LIVDRSANEILLVDIALLPDFRNLGWVRRYSAVYRQKG